MFILVSLCEESVLLIVLQNVEFRLEIQNYRVSGNFV